MTVRVGVITFPGTLDEPWNASADPFIFPSVKNYDDARL